MKKELKSWRTITPVLVATGLIITGAPLFYLGFLAVLAFINLQRQCMKCKNKCY